MFDKDTYEPEHLELALFLDVEDACNGDEALSNALMAMFGWTGEAPLTDLAASKVYGVDTVALQQARDRLTQYAQSNAPSQLEEVQEQLAETIPFPLPTLGEWLANNGYTRCRSFSIDSLLDALDVYGLPTRFRARTTEHTKWLVQPPQHDVDVSFVDEVVRKALSLAPQWGVIDVNDFEPLQRYFVKPGRLEEAWAAIDACPQLGTMDGTTFVFSRNPREDTKIVLRLNRLLSWHGAVPLEIARMQITRDGRDGVLPEGDHDPFETFVRHCAYYAIEDGDVVSRRDLVIDQELSARELPVILALVERPEGATVAELVVATPAAIGESQVRGVVTSSSLVVSLPDDRYALLDPSMFEAMLDEGQDVTTPSSISSTPVPPSLASTGDTDLVDLAELGHSGKHWWAMYAGPIPKRNLDGALTRQQKYMPIIDPETQHCLGMVRTSRVLNKFMDGIPSVLANDKGLAGTELPRICSQDDLQHALSEAPFVFYNDETRTGQESWGIVQRQDVGW
jgi:hypothetical protein